MWYTHSHPQRAGWGMGALSEHWLVCSGGIFCPGVCLRSSLGSFWGCTKLFAPMCSLDKMLLPQRQHETIHQKPGEALDSGEVMLDFSGTLDFPLGLWLTAFYLLQESGWLWAWMFGFQFFSPSSSPLWRSYSLFLDGKENNVLTWLPWNLGQSQIWSFILGRSSTAVTLLRSCVSCLPLHTLCCQHPMLFPVWPTWQIYHPSERVRASPPLWNLPWHPSAPSPIILFPYTFTLSTMFIEFVLCARWTKSIWSLSLQS